MFYLSIHRINIFSFSVHYWKYSEIEKNLHKINTMYYSLYVDMIQYDMT